MLTLRAAAALLVDSGDLTGLGALAHAVGFGEASGLPAEVADSLGIGDVARAAAVASGAGGLRALLVVAADGLAARDVVVRVAARLSVRSPELLWLVCVADGATTVAAAWSAERRPPRVSALAVERARVVDSDAETVGALATDADGGDVLAHARWLDVLGREALTRRFYRALERVVGGLAVAGRGSAPDDVRRAVALLTVSRLLFLSFLEAKGWLDGDRGFLQRGFDRCVASGGDYHGRVLRPLFFGTLNTPVSQRAAAAPRFGRVPFLNGGLFACGPVERRWRGLAFPDDSLGSVFGELLGRYRFTAREDAVGWTEAAVDPEMLGRAFEGLMAAGERKSSGAFYTPQPLVERVTRGALVAALSGGGVSEGAVLGALDGRAPHESAADLGRRAAALRVLDPACGSGAFLVHVLERLSAVRVACGDGRALDVVRRDVLTGSVFGVDVNPTAVWLCELRLWLSAVIDSEERDPLRVVPLPNLDRNVRVGDSLGGPAFGEGGDGSGRGVARLRDRYARASGSRKRTLARALERAERAAAVAAVGRELVSAVAVRAEQVRALRARDLFGERTSPSVAETGALEVARARVRRLREVKRGLEGGGALPFSYVAHFADVADEGGFGLVLGNPPWVRLHRVDAESRVRLRAEYRVFREAAWEAGSVAARAGRGFGGQVDLAALFVERSLRLARPGGVAALLVPGKLWHSLAGGGVRRLLTDGAELVSVADHGDGPSGFDAAVYPSAVVARRREGDALAATGAAVPTRVSVRTGVGEVGWSQAPDSLGIDRSEGAPWLLVPPAVRRGFDRLAAAGASLGSLAATGGAERPWLGVKSGCNEAFVGRVVGRDEGVVRLEGADGRREWVEAELVRPLVRGEGVRRWRVRDADEAIVWTMDADGAPVTALPPGARRWLRPFRAALERRSDRGRGPWWSLFRVDGSVGGGARVVWGDIGRRPRAAVMRAGDPAVVLNSCYVLRCVNEERAWAWAALLNSPIVGAWLHVVAEPARGGYRRYLGWTVGMLPVPRRWPAGVAVLAAAGRRAAGGDETSLGGAVLEAYGVEASEVGALLRWAE